MPTAVASKAGEEPTEAHTEERVTPLELFFDLVFVFAITQVTSMMAADPTWGGLARGLLILAVIWWAWAAYAWLTNAIDPEEGSTRLVMFTVMAAMLIVSLAVPTAFAADALLFGCAYFFVRGMHIVLFALAAEDIGLVTAVRQLARSAFSAAAIIVIASAFDSPVQELLFLLALLIDYAGVYLGDIGGWHLHPTHFVERHGLIVIIALGESIVAVGVGASGIGLEFKIVVAALLGIAVTAALWWAYFDVVAIVAERKMRELSGRAQRAMARDSYSVLHLPLVAGIVLLALGIKKTLVHVDDPLKTIPALALFGGVALYLIALSLIRLRNIGRLNYQRLIAAAVLLVLVPVGTEIAALASLALVAAVSCTLIAYEAIHFREARARIRGVRTR
jgi:low temperature requirement protein LtrA